MTGTKNIIRKIMVFSVVTLIFYFLVGHLYSSWEQIKAYEFSVNYAYVILSFLFFVVGFLGRGVPWRRIVHLLQPDTTVTYWEAVRFDVFAQLGKYLPGKVFALAGKVYLARDKNISKQNLYMSVILDNIFSLTASLVVSFLLIGFFLEHTFDFSRYYGIGLMGIAVLILMGHPRVLRYTTWLFFRLLQKEQVDLDFHVSEFQQAKIISYYILVELCIGLGFFWLVSSITNIDLHNVFALSGVYVFAGVLGLLAIFVPGGLGVREGVLVLLLGVYFPVSLAILISLLARVWTTLIEVFLVGGFYLYYKMKK